MAGQPSETDSGGTNLPGASPHLRCRRQHHPTTRPNLAHVVLVAYVRPRGRGGAFGLCPDCSPLTEWSTYSPSPRRAHRSPELPRLPRAITRQATTRPRAHRRATPRAAPRLSRVSTRQETKRLRSPRATPSICVSAPCERRRGSARGARHASELRLLAARIDAPRPELRPRVCLDAREVLTRAGV